MERNEPLSCKSSKKQQSLKKSVQETLRRSSRNKRNAYKRIILSDNSYSDEHNGTTSYSRETGGDNRHQKSPKNLEKDRQRSKKNAYKRINLRDNSSSDEHNDTTSYSCETVGDNRHKKSPKNLENDQPKSFVKPLKKRHSSKKTVEEISLRTRSSIRNAYKQVDVCEASTSNGLKTNTSKVQSDFLYSCTASESRRKEANRSLKLLSDKVKTSKDFQRIPDLKESSTADSHIDGVGNKDDSSVDLNLDLSKKDSDFSEFGTKGNDLLEADNATSAPETLSNKTDLSENATPFRFWGKGASKANETLKQSKDDEEHKKKDASAHFAPTLEKSYDPKKDWEKYSARAAFRKQIENKKELRRCKIDNVMNADKQKQHE